MSCRSICASRPCGKNIGPTRVILGGSIIIWTMCRDGAQFRIARCPLLLWPLQASRRPPAGCCAGFCKQQLWPLFHYLIPLSPTSAERFDPILWQAYVKANKVHMPPGAHLTAASPTLELGCAHCQASSLERAQIRSYLNLFSVFDVCSASTDLMWCQHGQNRRAACVGHCIHRPGMDHLRHGGPICPCKHLR